MHGIVTTWGGWPETFEYLRGITCQVTFRQLKIERIMRLYQYLADLQAHQWFNFQVSKRHLARYPSKVFIYLIIYHMTCVTIKWTLRTLLWSLWGPANPSLGMTPTKKYYSTVVIDHIL